MSQQADAGMDALASATANPYGAALPWPDRPGSVGRGGEEPGEAEAPARVEGVHCCSLLCCWDE